MKFFSGKMDTFDKLFKEKYNTQKERLSTLHKIIVETAKPRALESLEKQFLQVTEEKKKLEEELSFITNDSEKMLENQINQKIKILMKFKDENYHLKLEVNELKQRNEIMEKKMGIQEYDSKQISGDSYQMKFLYEELVSKLFKMKSSKQIHQSNESIEERHDKAISILKKLEDAMDVYSHDPKILKTNKTNSKTIEEQQKKTKTQNSTPDNPSKSNRNKIDKLTLQKNNVSFVSKPSAKGAFDPNKSFS